MKLGILILIILAFSGFKDVKSQEINFGQDYSTLYTLSSTLTNGALDFGFLSQSEGTVEITIDDAAVIEVEGTEYMDIFIDISSDGPFQTSGCGGPSCQIPLTIEASYSNFGEISEIAAKNKSVYIGSSTTSLSAQVPILRRGNAPPGPPPTPVYQGYNLDAFKESAFIFVYGSIFVSGADPGVYSSSISVTISYD